MLSSLIGALVGPLLATGASYTDTTALLTLDPLGDRPGYETRFLIADGPDVAHVTRADYEKTMTSCRNDYARLPRVFPDFKVRVFVCDTNQDE